jgi:putative acetyltransferase
MWRGERATGSKRHVGTIATDGRGHAPSRVLSRYVRKMRVRAEELADEAAANRVIAEAFGDDGAAVALLADELRGLVAADAGSSFVAELDGQIVGHVMFTRSLLDAPPRLVDVQVLSPLAVDPEHQRQGIGSELVRAGLEEMRRQGVPVVFLEGSPAYYRRFGFAAGGELGFRKPSLRIPDVAFMALPLATYEPWMTGTLVYAHEFWDSDAVGLRDASH